MTQVFHNHPKTPVISGFSLLKGMDGKPIALLTRHYTTMEIRQDL
jgi:hypothetical protein